MPEKSLTIATYAAGASLAAITLVYVFGPTFLIDGGSEGTVSNKRTRVVGLVNPANDCFINSVLQALAGLGDLRLFLIRETHRRNLDGEVYSVVEHDPSKKGQAEWRVQGLQSGLVTAGLKDILDALNERPIYKKTISAAGFVKVLEVAFRQRISRQQQDAQEFLQVVAERLLDEYHAGARARKRAKSVTDSQQDMPLDKAVDQRLERLVNGETGKIDGEMEKGRQPGDLQALGGNDQSEDGFPLEGKSESQIECQTCGFKPKPSESTFCTLTLNVPQVSSTTLSSCFDGMFKTEFIDDFKCEKCRLLLAKDNYERELASTKSESHQEACRKAIEKLQQTIDTDPEDPPEDVTLPDWKLAPKRKIARHIRITKFPKTLAIHLSRSIFDVGQMSSKNSAKISFPETLPLGSILSPKKYKLLAVVCHKGSHHSGHYESFRRQSLSLPFSTPNMANKNGIYSVSKPGTPVAATPLIGAMHAPEDSQVPSSERSSPISVSSTSLSLPSAPSPPRPMSSSSSITPAKNSQPASSQPQAQAQDLGSVPDKNTSTSSLRSITRSARHTLSKMPSTVSLSSSKPPKGGERTSVDGGQVQNARQRRRQQKGSDRWWRISDDKVKESKTSEVLNMQREVYLLFYELIRD